MTIKNDKHESTIRPRILKRWLILKLRQIPEIAIQIFKDSNGAVRLFLWLPYKLDTFGLHGVIIPPEIERQIEN